MIVYMSEDDGTLYIQGEVDFDPATGAAPGYTRHQLEDSFTLTAEQCCGSYGSIGEILSKAGKLTKLD